MKMEEIDDFEKMLREKYPPDILPPQVLQEIMGLLLNHVGHILLTPVASISKDLD